MPDKPDVASTLYKAAHPARRSGVRLVSFLAVSLVAAIGSALLLTRYMDRRTAEAHVPTRPVVVAAMDLPVGAELRTENLAVADWPEASVPDGAFQEPKDLEGKVVAVRLYRREPLLAAKLAGAPNGGLSALLPPGMRAAAVRVDDVVGVAGFVQPGDSVDVIATIRQDGGQAITSSKVILQNVRVLAVGKELDTRARPDKVVPATVATLMVDASQSERLALAAAQGKILLTLRSAADTDVVATDGVTAAALISKPDTEPRPQPAVASRRARAAAAVAQAAPAPEKPRDEVVEILRGDVFEKRKFEGKAP
jgi:pilus assembly protein CpaB